MLGEKLEFAGLTGVGRVQLDLEPDQHIYTFIGENGVGKTKTLEALFQVAFVSHQAVAESTNPFTKQDFKFHGFLRKTSPSLSANLNSEDNIFIRNWHNKIFAEMRHNLPVIFLGAQARGIIKNDGSSYRLHFGNLKKRREQYLYDLIEKMKTDFSSLNMGTSIEEWFVTLARSSNPYQKKEDNRDVEIKTVIRLLSEIDNRIDSEFMEISGDDRVSLKIENQKRELSQLSSGFASILKLIQAIVSGYGYFTNETNLQHVKGIVFIDEIESHLHLTWQANIIPLLKTLFPNTLFYITTHSSIVLSQLKEGEAYTLYRDDSGTVKSRKIEAPNKAALVDIMKDVFKVDLNQMKLENSNADEQQEAKSTLLQLLKQQEKK
ncbi:MULTISPECIES: AAA family ATPase [Pseudescherichia]|uniref:AAA family ATPase n=1 Tax=Pseudescherichia TaxID=2055880 RepID=UPI0028A17B55|nr:AAA family ATPase [Pseudescherichia sp.]